MDRELAFGFVGQDRRRTVSHDPDLLPSRLDGRAAIRAALLAGRGPILLTGEPGVGKSTLLRGLEADRTAGTRWTSVEAFMGTGAEGLYRLIAHAARVGSGPFGRLDLLDLLAERSADRERWTLAIDDAQNLDPTAIDEVRALAGRIGEPDGFAAILLVGQPTLARRLSLRSGAGLGARISTHVHLRPLDADEVGLLLKHSAPDHPWPVATADRVQMLAGGLPGRVVEIAARSRPRAEIPRPAEVPAPAREESLLGASKPPIRVEDGLIEVGWEPEADARGDDDADFERPTDSEREDSGDVEERINDHYAALQAWQEWAANQGRHPEVAPAVAEVVDDDEGSPLAESANIWADEEHGFAPFGRLFTRQSHSQDAE